jgi:type I restriction enzyme S subunit
MIERNANRPGYKKTPVGWIPVEWECQRLSEALATIIDYRGKAPNKTEVGIPLITARNVRKGYIEFDAGKEFIPEEEYQSWMCRGMPRPGDVLFTTEAPLGNVAMFPENGKYALAQRLVTMRGRQDRMLGEFLLYFLLSPGGARSVERLGTGSTAIGIKQSTLLTLEIPLPPLPEQRQIAAILSTWDTAIDQTRALLAAAQRRKKALMQQLLTGKKRLPGFGKPEKWQKTPCGHLPEDWQLKPLSEVFAPVKRRNAKGVTLVLTASGQKGLVDQRSYFSKAIAGAIQTGYYLLRRGEFAYNRSAMEDYPFGAIKRLELHDEGILSTLYSCFRLNDHNCDSDFYTQFFETRTLDRQLRSIAHVGGRAHGLLNVTDSDFYAIRAPVPSLNEQRAIAAILATADDEIKTLEAKAAALEQQKKGLMQKLLSGEIRVKG